MITVNIGAFQHRSLDRIISARGNAFNRDPELRNILNEIVIMSDEYFSNKKVQYLITQSLNNDDVETTIYILIDDVKMGRRFDVDIDVLINNKICGPFIVSVFKDMFEEYFRIENTRRVLIEKI